ncbi:MAG: redoxin domain-containing protein [Bacteroidaceae bacterium]|nr:redoxin domain-containing protein [Bacteroidaceae bacterium]
MKKILMLAACVALFSSCADEYEITVQNLSDDIKVMYLYNVEGEAQVIDSAAVENGVAKMKGKIGTTIAEVRPDKESFYVPVILDDEPLTLTYADNDATISVGSAQNMQLNLYCTTMTSFGKKYQEFMMDVQMLQNKNGGTLDPSDMKDLEKRYNEMFGAVTQTVTDIVNNNKDNLVPAVILRSRDCPLEEEFIAEFMAGYSKADIAYLEPVRAKLDSKKLMQKGAEVKDFVMNDLNGEPRHLTDFVGKGNIVLVDFWASWCGPCRREMPTVKQAYSTYHGKGFDIVGISLDDNKDDWAKAVADLGITWTQLSDLKGWQCEGAQIYGVNAIPCTILYDGEGKVIASGLTGEALMSKLEELYK